MDDKVFNLLEKMYAEMNEKFDQVNQRFDKVDSRLTKIESTIENDIKPSIKMCLDEVVSIKENQTAIEQKLDALSDKVDRHDIKIQVIEGGKRA